MAWLGRIWRFLRRDDRLLFGYWDGSRQRLIDPLSAWRQVWNSQGVSEFAADVRRSSNPMREDGQPFYQAEEVYGAEDRLRNLTRAVFGVKEWTESQAGLTLDETDHLLDRFMRFIEDIKKKRNLLRTSSPPTESRERSSSQDFDDFPDGVESESSSSATESSAAAHAGP